eukprot:1150870-Pelagomonas_calceolata.AAC.3
MQWLAVLGAGPARGGKETAAVGCGLNTITNQSTTVCCVLCAECRAYKGRQRDSRACMLSLLLDWVRPSPRSHPETEELRLQVGTTRKGKKNGSDREVM